MGKRSRKLNIPMLAALILLCLTLISIHLTCGLYARYTSTAQLTDSARVAKFDVQCEVGPGENHGEFLVTVTNKSEVAVHYSLLVSYEGPMNATMDSGTVLSPATEGETNLTFTDTDWVLAPGALPVVHKLTLSVSDWDKLTESMTGIEDQANLEFTVGIHAVQVD